MTNKEKHLSYLKEKGKFHFDYACGIYSSEEIEILTKFGHWFQALTDGELEPFTDLQRHFISVSKGDTSPFSLEEKAWHKYSGRKKYYEKNQERMNLQYSPEDNGWYKNDDIKKVRSGAMKTVWETHSRPAQLFKLKTTK